MSKCTIVIDSDTTFYANKGDNLLATLNKQCEISKHACRNGNCRICRCQLVSGHIDYQNKIPIALSDDDIKKGWILTCISTLITDIEITNVNTK